jgi:hypothetical protein
MISAEHVGVLGLVHVCTSGMKMATIAVELIMQPTMARDVINSTTTRTSLPPDAWDR